METTEFKKLYNNLNPAQKEAVDAIEGAVMVVAGPGTGKTQVLTLRIANILLKTQVNPENILALTFTESAAFEMRKRLLLIMGHDAYRVEITTFHSFCNNFIKIHQEDFAHMIASENINEIEQLQIIEAGVDSLSVNILRPLGDPTYYLKPILNAINELKRENVTPKVFEKALTEFKKDLDNTPDLYHEKGAYKGKMKSDYQKLYKDYEKNKELFLIFDYYQKKMFENKKYDYNDMLLEVINKLENHQYLLQIIQEKFQYFLVDEHQDTNAAQNKIVELLCNYFDNPNLFVVGDEKQAIFRFQGATLENFLYFKKLYKHAKLINLSENYRSTQTILDATHQLILNNPKLTQILSEPKGLTKKSLHEEGKIQVAQFQNIDLEYFWIVQKIKELQKLNSINDSKIAILARNNKDLDGLISIFDNAKIPYIIEADNNILDDLDVQKLILLFYVLSDPLKNREEYLKKIILFDCFNINPLDVFKLIHKSQERKTSLWEILQNEKQKEINDFVTLFNDKDTGLIKEAANERFDKVFVDTLNRTGLLQKILEKSHAQEILNRITKLYDEVKNEIGKNNTYSLSDFLTYIDLLRKNDISLKQNAHIVPSNVVRLMTVHKSKGLEFDYVFIINVFDGHWGNSKKRGSLFHLPWEHLSLRLNKDLEDDKNVDERRLFYVALTRAKKNIFLSYSIQSMDGKEQVPSQFISEIPEKFVEKIDVINFENNFLSHQEKLLKSFEKEISDKSNSLFHSKEYIGNLFKSQGLSVSALNNYLDCPWKFFFVNLIRIPQVISDAGLFGNAIHATLNYYIRTFKIKSVNKELLLHKFDEELKLQGIGSNNFDGFFKRGEKALSGFYEEMKNWKKDVESEIEIRGIQISKDIMLNGKIDMIRPIKKDVVDVYDFKTGKQKSRAEIEGLTKNGNGNYKRQLVFYKILLDKYRNGFYKMQDGIIEFVEPNEKDIFKSERFTINKEEIENLLKQIIEIGNDIINFSFWNKKCDDKKCEYCNLRSYLGN